MSLRNFKLGMRDGVLRGDELLPLQSMTNSPILPMSRLLPSGTESRGERVNRLLPPKRECSQVGSWLGGKETEIKGKGH